MALSSKTSLSTKTGLRRARRSKVALADAKALKRVGMSVPKCASVVSDKERGRNFPTECFFSSRSSGSITACHAIAPELIWIQKLFIDGK